MSDAELTELGEDITANGLKAPIAFHVPGEWKDKNNYWLYDRRQKLQLLDGRNRLTALQRVGFLGKDNEEDLSEDEVQFIRDDPVAFVISANIRRRHLTKQQQAELIVAAVKAGEKPPQVEVVSKGGRGKVNKAKAEAVKHAAEAGISKATVERAIAKAELTPEQLQQKFQEQQAKRDEARRERQEEAAELKNRRLEGLKEALAILDRLDLDAAERLVVLLGDAGLWADVILALDGKKSDPEDARAAVDEFIEQQLDLEEAIASRPAVCTACDGKGCPTCRPRAHGLTTVKEDVFPDLPTSLDRRVSS
jgi:hypothetical protein